MIACLPIFLCIVSLLPYHTTDVSRRCKYLAVCVADTCCGVQAVYLNSHWQLEGASAAPMLAVAACICYSRIHLQMHTWAQITVGALVGVLLAIQVQFLSQNFLLRQEFLA